MSKYPIYHWNIKQNSQEWYDVRKGRMTASKAQAIANNGKGLDTYINNLMAEYYSSAEPEQYTNPDIERGNELEEQARDVYELETGRKVEQVGFIELDEFVGCSPDGLIDEDGGLEIKCLKDEKYFKALVEGIDSVVSDYNWQIQMNLYITGRKWWQLVLYNPNFKQNILIKTVYPDPEKQEQLKEGLETGKEKIKNIKSKFKN